MAYISHSLRISQSLDEASINAHKEGSTQKDEACEEPYVGQKARFSTQFCPVSGARV